MKSKSSTKKTGAERVAKHAGNATRPAGAVGKLELCQALGWARTTLDRRIDTDGSFPVLQRGAQSGGWAFDLAAVRAYLAGEKSPAHRGSDDSAAGDEDGDSASMAPTATAGEATARQRRDAAQAAMLEDKLRLSRGELVEAEGMRVVLATMLAKLGKGLDSLPEAIVDRFSMPEKHADVLRNMIDALRRTMVDDLRTLLPQG